MTTPERDLDLIAEWLRGRGEVPTPPDLLGRARAEAARPVALRPRLLTGSRRLAWIPAAAAIALVAVALLPGPRTGPTAAPARAAAPVLLLHDGASGLRLVAADPATGEPLPGREPIPGHAYAQTALGPDGRTLAVVARHERADAGSELYTVDLASGAVTEHEVGIGGEATLVQWSADGTELLWFEPTLSTDDEGIVRSFRLARWRMGTTEVRQTAVLPRDLIPHEARVRGDDLLVYGQAVDEGWVAADVPHVLRIDLATDRIVADQPLEGVVAGVQGEGTEEDAVLPYEQPALAWDLERGRLFVASQDRLTRVDLSGDLGLEAHAIAPRTALLDRVLAWLVPAASAKSLQPGDRLTAGLSPAGDRLYLTGVRVRATGDQLSWEHLGLRVVDTGDGALLATYAGPIDQVLVSGDGRRLLVTGTPDIDDDTARVAHPTGTNELVLLDADGLAEVSRLAAPDQHAIRHLAGVSRDGRFGYVMTWLTVGSPGGAQTLEVIDLGVGSVVRSEVPDGMLDVVTFGG